MPGNSRTYLFGLGGGKSHRIRKFRSQFWSSSHQLVSHLNCGELLRVCIPTSQGFQEDSSK